MLTQAIKTRWRLSQKRRAAGHNQQHVINRRLRELPTCPEWLRLSPGLPSPTEAGLWQLTQGSRYGSHHARSLETSWWIGNKNCQILRRTHSKLCYICKNFTRIECMLLNFTPVIQQNCHQPGRNFEKSFCAVDRLSCQLELSKSETVYKIVGLR